VALFDPFSGHGFPRSRGFTITLRHTSQSVELLWTSDQTVAGASTLQHATFKRDRHPCPRGIRTHSPSKWTTANPHLRPHGHWDRRQKVILLAYIQVFWSSKSLTHYVGGYNNLIIVLKPTFSCWKMFVAAEFLTPVLLIIALSSSHPV
jgi:hypothetical protein